MSVEELQRLLSEQIPGWDTQRIGDLDDPDNIRTPATVLDSLLHAHGDPAELNILSQEELAPLMYPFDKPRAHYNSPVKHKWTVNPSDAEYKSDVWWKSTFNPLGYLGEKVKGGQTGRIYGSTLYDLIEELAHDLQFKDPQYKASKTGHADYVDAGDPTYSDVPYKTEGTLEWEAHSDIAPSLWNLLRKIKTSDKELIGYGDFGSNKYPHTSLSDYGEGKYTWPIERYKYKPLIEDEDNPLIKDGQNQSQTIRPASSVHDVGKVY